MFLIYIISYDVWFYVSHVALHQYYIYKKMKPHQIKDGYINDIREHFRCDVVVKNRIKRLLSNNQIIINNNIIKLNKNKKSLYLVNLIFKLIKKF